ncbi:MAG: hypothetical protein EZS28_022805 [Streblomastix strix]|uniref:Uncharacterized protein n=1 Tax=Streblomastix strix TaxID=222440 RepID=A0A5J4VH22_9EUKA|nr:MAG: hypothetical protein EZS28_022805 [Streblomastix strix]
MVFYGAVAAFVESYILTIRTLNLPQLYTLTVVVAIVCGLKSCIQSYKYNDAQFLVCTGKELKMGFNQFKSNTLLKTVSFGIRQQQLVAAAAVLIASNGTSINTPQCRFPPMILSSGETLTELLVHKSLNEFADIIAYSLAQIDVSHNFVLSLHIANQLNGPQAVEKPSQNRRTSEVAYPYPPGSAAVIGIVWSAVISSNALKLAMTLAVALLETGAAAILFNYIANVFAVYAANNQIIDGQASDFALKIAPDADIVGVKNDIISIQQVLARQQHFRGYYLLNADITSLPDSADGDFAFNAESGTVWMYDTNWYNSGQVVPDQVSPASDAVPLVDSATGAAGVSNEYSRGYHQHPLQISSVLPSADTAAGEAGTAATYAMSDHTHHVNLSNDVPVKDGGTGTAGSSNIYASATHYHPPNVDPTVANVPLVNTTAAANGTSDFYCRIDQVHPQQLTYDGNITATKFIKTGGLSTELLVANGNSTTDFVTKTTTQTITGVKTFNNQITADGYKIPNGTSQQMLLANGSTKPLVLAEKNFYITGSLQYIKLCSFSAFTEPNDASVEFTCNCRTGFGLIQFNQVYTSDGIGTYQYKLQSNMSYGMDVCYIIYFGTGADRYGELWARVLMWSNYLTFQQTNQSQETAPLNDVLISEMQPQLPSGVSSSTALFANYFNSVVHISSNLNDNRAGLRIARQANGAGIYLGSSPATDGGVTAGQWNIITTPDNSAQNPLGFTICLRTDATKNNRGLRISTDGNTLTFNGRTL